MPRDAERFLGDLEATAARAAGAVGGFQEVGVRLAGHDLRLRFAGPALVSRLAPAVEHVRITSIASTALTVDLWDSESTGTAMPAPPWNPDDYREHGKLRGFFGDQLYGLFNWGSHALSILDVAGERAFYWVKAAEQIGYFEMAAPLRTIVYLWLRDSDVALVHASAVGTPAGCVLLVGRAGVGKSSATLACLSSELGILADDYCLLGPGPQPTVHTLYSAAKAHEDTLQRMPFLAPMVVNPDRPWNEKALLFLHRHHPEKIVAHAPLRAIVLPRVTPGASTRVRRASSTAALAALAPSTLLQLPGATQTTLARLAEVVRHTPCYQLETGRDPAGVSRALEPLLAT
jgi:hypothetical protein